MNDRNERAERFWSLHQRETPLLLPNPWDRGSARLLAHLGFEALATTSFGAANHLGVLRPGRSELLENCRAIASATPLPLTADLEDGYAAEPREAAGMLIEAAACGAVGGSIEDHTGDPKQPIYEFDHAVERVHAAVEAARSLSHRFVVTARAENFLHGRRDLDDTIRRLQAFEAVGADVLYAPGLRNLEEMRTVVDNVGRPVNVVMGFADPRITLEQLSEIGVRRISIGGALSRVALRAFLEAAQSMREGRFDFVREMATPASLHQAFRAFAE